MSLGIACLTRSLDFGIRCFTVMWASGGPLKKMMLFIVSELGPAQSQRQLSTNKTQDKKDRDLPCRLFIGNCVFDVRAETVVQYSVLPHCCS